MMPDAIAQCSREAYNDEIANFDHKNIFLEHPTADEVKNYIESQTYYKIKLNGDIIGGVFVFKETVHTASIEDFCISPAHQNKGYGQLILKEIERLHNDIKKWRAYHPYL